MKIVHVRNLEKYQDGYKDRRHHWSKIYIDMIQGNPEAEMLCEIDFARLVKFIVLESCIPTHEVPANETYLARKGFDFGLRSLATTLRELQHFVEVIDIPNVTENHVFDTKSSPREEKNREEKKKINLAWFEELWSLYPAKDGRKDALRHFGCSVRTEADFQRIKTALANYKAHLSKNPWKQPKNGSTWFNNWQDWEKADAITTEDQKLKDLEERLSKK